MSNKSWASPLLGEVSITCPSTWMRWGIDGKRLGPPFSHLWRFFVQSRDTQPNRRKRKQSKRGGGIACTRQLRSWQITLLRRLNVRNMGTPLRKSPGKMGDLNMQTHCSATADLERNNEKDAPDRYPLTLIFLCLQVRQPVLVLRCGFLAVGLGFKSGILFVLLLFPNRSGILASSMFANGTARDTRVRLREVERRLNAARITQRVKEECQCVAFESGYRSEPRQLAG